jgi:hypothetical protein
MTVAYSKRASSDAARAKIEAGAAFGYFTGLGNSCQSRTSAEVASRRWLARRTLHNGHSHHFRRSVASW